MAELRRVPVVAEMCLRPGYLRLRLDLPQLPPRTMRILDGVPDDVPLELVPPDLRPLGSRFVIVFEPWGPVVAVEPCGGQA
jgi:hypothetical protein